MDNCDFHSNASSNSGGAIYVDYTTGDPGVNVTLRNNTTFTNNFAAASGGAVFAGGTPANSLTVSACVFNGNTAYGAYGGAIASQGDQLSVSGGSFTNNKAAFEAMMAAGKREGRIDVAYSLEAIDDRAVEGSAERKCQMEKGR